MADALPNPCVVYVLKGTARPNKVRTCSRTGPWGSLAGGDKILKRLDFNESTGHVRLHGPVFGIPGETNSTLCPEENPILNNMFDFFHNLIRKLQDDCLVLFSPPCWPPFTPAPSTIKLVIYAVIGGTYFTGSVACHLGDADGSRYSCQSIARNFPS